MKHTPASRITSALRRRTGTRAEFARASVLVHSPASNLDVLARSDDSSPDAFHVASVGKLFTTALVGMLVDEGAFALDDPVAPLLPAGTLDRLFVTDGVDHQHEVTVRHLLSHTSGASDYFAGATTDGAPVSRLMVEEPERSWTPAELLEFSRERQAAVGTPGQRFHYSDTGFVVLGMLVEQATGTAFHDALAARLFGPLRMGRSWMPGRSVPAEGPATFRPAFIGGVDLSGAASITADWSGGGVASTERDLARFARALFAEGLVSRGTLDAMMRFDSTFRRGIEYGGGIMRYDFGAFFFLLRSWPRLVGHMGVLGTQLFYDPQRDLVIAASIGSDAGTAASVRLLIDVLGVALRAS